MMITMVDIARVNDGVNGYMGGTDDDFKAIIKNDTCKLLKWQLWKWQSQ